MSLKRRDPMNPMGLEDALNEFISQRVYIPPTIQNYLGGVLSSAYSTEAERMAGGSLQDPGDYISNSPFRAQITQNVLSQPAPTNLQNLKPFLYKTGKVFDKNGKVIAQAPMPAEFRSELNRGVGLIQQAGTLGDIQNLLLRSVTGVIGEQSRKSALNGGDVVDNIASRSLSILEGIPNYDPKFNFLDYATNLSMHGATASRRIDDAARPRGTLSLDFTNAEGEPILDVGALDNVNNGFPEWTPVENGTADVRFPALWSPSGHIFTDSGAPEQFANFPREGYRPVYANYNDLLGLSDVVNGVGDNDLRSAEFNASYSILQEQFANQAASEWVRFEIPSGNDAQVVAKTQQTQRLGQFTPVGLYVDPNETGVVAQTVLNSQITPGFETKYGTPQGMPASPMTNPSDTYPLGGAMSGVPFRTGAQTPPTGPVKVIAWSRDNFRRDVYVPSTPYDGPVGNEEIGAQFTRSTNQATPSLGMSLSQEPGEREEPSVALPVGTSSGSLAHSSQAAPGPGATQVASDWTLYKNVPQAQATEPQKFIPAAQEYKSRFRFRDRIIQRVAGYPGEFNKSALRPYANDAVVNPSPSLPDTTTGETVYGRLLNEEGLFPTLYNTPDEGRIQVAVTPDEAMVLSGLPEPAVLGNSAFHGQLGDPEARKGLRDQIEGLNNLSVENSKRQPNDQDPRIGAQMGVLTRLRSSVRRMISSLVGHEVLPPEKPNPWSYPEEERPRNDGISNLEELRRNTGEGSLPADRENMEYTAYTGPGRGETILDGYKENVPQDPEPSQWYSEAGYQSVVKRSLDAPSPSSPYGLQHYIAKYAAIGTTAGALEAYGRSDMSARALHNAARSSGQRMLVDAGLIEDDREVADIPVPEGPPDDFYSPEAMGEPDFGPPMEEEPPMEEPGYEQGSVSTSKGIPPEIMRRVDENFQSYVKWQGGVSRAQGLLNGNKQGVYMGAKAILESFPLQTKLRAPTISSRGHENSWAWYSKGQVFLTDKYFNDASLTDARAEENIGPGSLTEKRARVLAHEAGHQLAGPALITRAQAQIDYLMENSPEFQARVNGLPQGHPYRRPGELGRELAADVIGSVLGHPQARLETRFGLSGDALNEMQMSAIAEMEKQGHISRAQANMLRRNLPERVAADMPFEPDNFDPGDMPSEPTPPADWGWDDPAGFVGDNEPPGANEFYARDTMSARPADMSLRNAHLTPNDPVGPHFTTTFSRPDRLSMIAPAARYTPGDLLSLGSGTLHVAGRRDPQTGKVLGASVVAPKYDEEGNLVPGEARTILNEGQVGNAINSMKTGLAGILSQDNLPGAGPDFVASVNKQMQDYIKGYVKNFVDTALQQQGRSPETLATVDEQASKLTSLMKATANRWVGDIAGMQVDDEGHFAAGTSDWKNHAYSAIKLPNKEAVAAYAKKNPEFGKWVEEQGGADELASGAYRITSVGGNTYEMGEGVGGYGSQFGGGGGFGGRNFWGGTMGNFLYASYLTKRFWSMTAAPVFQAMEKYSDLSAKTLPLGYMGAADQMDYEGTAAGYHSARALSEERLGRAAWEEFGAFSELGPALTEGPGGEAVSRLSATGRVIGGLGAAGFILGQTKLAGMFVGPEAAAGMASFAPWAGAAAIGLGGAALTTEGYNALVRSGGAELALSGVYSTLGLSDVYGNYKPREMSLGEWAREAGRFGYAAGRTLLNNGVTGGGAQMDAIFRTQLPGIFDWLTAPERRKATVGADAETETALENFANKTSQSSDEAAGAYFSAQGLYGGVIKEGTPEFDMMTTMTKTAATEGVAASTFMNQAGSYAANMGFIPGTSDFFKQTFDYSQLSVSDRYKADQEASRLTSNASQLAPYLKGGLNAARDIIKKYGLETQQDVGKVQSAFAIAAQFGVNLDQVIDAKGTRAMDRAEMMGGYSSSSIIGYTNADMLANYFSGMNSFQANIATTSMNTLLEAGAPFSEDVMKTAENLNIKSKAQVGALQSYMDFAQSYGPVSGDAAEAIAGFSQGQNPYQSSIMLRLAEPLMRTGHFDAESALGYVSNLGMSNQQAFITSQIASGDMGAASWNSYNGGGIDTRFLNQSGQPIQTTDFGSFLRMASAQFQQSNAGALNPSVSAANWSFINGGSTLDATQAFFGSVGTSGDAEAMNAWANGGAVGRTLLHNERMYGYQMAGIGIQLQGIQLQANFNWGANEGGTWDNPAAGSLWAMQDQQRQMQYKSQITSFATQRERMELQNSFAQEQEGISYSRMAANQNYQRWNMAFDQQTNLLQRGWTREDWQFSDQMSNLQFGWQMEDINDAIRTSSGRDRTKLVTQRERATLSQNLNEEHTEDTRKRQEELWSREDERFSKQKEYSEKLMDLDEKSYDLQKRQREAFYALDKRELARAEEEYKKQFKLQTDIINKQREFQYEQMELQKQAAGIQAAAAAETKKYNDEMTKVQQTYDNITGAWREAAKYDPTSVIKALGGLSERMATVDTYRVDSVSRAVTTFSMLNGDVISDFSGLIDAINHVNVYKIQKLIDLIEETM